MEIPKLICLSGPDGAGKTTLAIILCRHLQRHNFRVKYSFIRGSYIPIAILAKGLTKMESFKGIIRTCVNEPIYNIRIPSHMQKLWQIFEFASFLIVFFIRYYLPSLLGYIVVGDRGPLDSLVWIMLVTNDKNYVHKIQGRFLLYLSRGFCSIYVTATYKELIKRKYDTSQKFMWEQLKVYEELSSLYGIHKLDTTNKEIKESFHELLHRISEF
jgi:thymidylate kinase